MSTVIIKSEEFSNIDELHLLLKKRLQLPEYYGNNLDALWDCLTGWIELPMTFKWIGFEDSRQKIGEYAEKLAKVLQEVEQEIDGFRVIITN